MKYGLWVEEVGYKISRFTYLRVSLPLDRSLTSHNIPLMCAYRVYVYLCTHTYMYTIFEKVYVNVCPLTSERPWRSG